MSQEIKTSTRQPGTLEWRWPGAAKKPHLYLVGGDGRSLCGKWMFFTSNEGVWTGESMKGQDCQDCVKRALKNYPVNKEGTLP